MTPAENLQDNDPTATTRKQDHIDLAFASRTGHDALDTRFYYEPIFAAHPKKGQRSWKGNFLGKPCEVPLWVSSMTGGTEKAHSINRNLARACNEFGMGMGLGSCRQLLYSDEYLPDFEVRNIMGSTPPLYANLGVAQVEKLIQQNDTARIWKMLDKLQADGLIIHVNPLQEAMQPEGDRFEVSPLQTIEELLHQSPKPIIVKEVGQGMGPQSLKALLQLPLAAVEFAAAGGTNFAKLELLRAPDAQQQLFHSIAHLGHTASEMVDMTNIAVTELGSACKVQEIIISGGVRDFMDGYYLLKKSKLKAVFGQASGFLRFAAQADYSPLQQFIQAQIQGLELAQAYLTIKQ